MYQVVNEFYRSRFSRSCQSLNPLDDDLAWKREANAQQRARSMTLKMVMWDPSAAPAPSDAELDLATQRHYQLRRQYRRLAKAAEEQRIITRRLHIV
jgi:hypothetical protein